MRLLLTFLIALLIAPAAARAQDSAAFAELAGEAGCLVQSGLLTDDEEESGESALKGCAKGRGLMSASAVTVSPDGKNVYVAAGGTRSYGSNAVVTLSRATDTGRVSFTECVSDDGGDGRVGTDGMCLNGDALQGASDVVLSPDGKSAYVTAAGSNGVSWFARDEASGRLMQKGCVKDVPREDNCADGEALIGASAGAVSPDGVHLYVASRISDAVAIFTRDAETGAIEQTGCISQTGSDGLCTDGTALTGASSVVVSSDGAHVYVTAGEVGAVTTYARDAKTGLLTPKGCLVADAPEGGVCTSSKPLAGAADAVLTPDGAQLIVASRIYGTLTTFTRDAATGALAPKDCLQYRYAKGDEVIPDEEEEEFEEELDEEEQADEEEDARAAQDDEDEDALLAGCRPAKATESVSDVTVSADGKAVFAATGDSMAAFQRDPLTGNLTQFACAESYRTYKSCTQSRGLYSASGIAASPDARNLYMVSPNTGTVSTYGAVTAVASASARLAANGTAAVRLACPGARARACRGRVAVARTSRHARGNRFLLAPGRSTSVRVKVPRAVRSAVRRRRSARVMLVVRDAQKATRLTGRRITLRR